MNSSVRYGKERIILLNRLERMLRQFNKKYAAFIRRRVILRNFDKFAVLSDHDLSEIGLSRSDLTPVSLANSNSWRHANPIQFPRGSIHSLSFSREKSNGNHH